MSQPDISIPDPKFKQVNIAIDGKEVVQADNGMVMFNRNLVKDDIREALNVIQIAFPEMIEISEKEPGFFARIFGRFRKWTI